MEVPLLQTKLYISPTRSELVSRPRLNEQLNEGLYRKLTLISAPAGFGKTTLVSDWLRQLDVPAAWLSLDENENDPTRFLTYFITALQKINSSIGQAAQTMLQSPQLPPLETLITTLINDISATFTNTQPVLVLDDYHLIEAQSVHDALTFLLEYLPAPPGGVHLVITTREDPRLPLARLRARGQLTELRAADLRFTTAEAAEFLNQMMGLNLSAEEVDALESRTEGWIAGLQMAALSMQGRTDTAGFIQAFTGSHRFIIDYLVEEVLQRQPDLVRSFLLQTAILDRLTGPLCDATLGRGALRLRSGQAGEQGSAGEFSPSPLRPRTPAPLHLAPSTSGQAILEYLEHANLFIVPLDDERRWYRYHHLFADLLRHRLRQNLPDQVPTLHRRASEWYEENGLLTEAVDHALVAVDLERAADLIERTAWEVLTRGEMVILLGWLERLPADLAHSRPRLRLFHAWALALTGQLDAVEPHLPDIDIQDLPGEVAAVRAYVAFLRQDVPRAIELSRQALEQLPSSNSFMRSIMALSLGTASYWTLGDPAAACRTLTEAVNLSRGAGDSHLTLVATSTLGHAQQMRGRLHLAAETHQQALQLVDVQGRRPMPFVGLTYIGLAGLLYEWNDLDGAKRYAIEGVELGERGASIDVLQGGDSYLVLAQVYQARGEVKNALEMIRKAEQFAQKYNQSYVLALVAAFRAQMWIARGNVMAAARWAQKHGVSANDELSYSREFEHITLTRLLIAQEQAGEALGLLARLLEAAQAAERMGSVIKMLALQVLAFQTLSDLERAVSALEQALNLAEPEGYVRTFVDEGEPMAKLLRRTLSQGISPNYVARLLAAFEEAVEPASSSAQALVEPLSKRELEVLRLVVAGLSNPEIAQELVVAVSTVKSHLNHIYGKLGVKSRVQAIERARASDLL